MNGRKPCNCIQCQTVRAINYGKMCRLNDTFKEGVEVIQSIVSNMQQYMENEKKRLNDK